MLKIEQHPRTGFLMITVEHEQTQTFEPPKSAADSMDIAEAVSDKPEVQRAVADRLNHLFGFVPCPPAPDPVPEDEAS